LEGEDGIGVVREGFVLRGIRLLVGLEGLKGEVKMARGDIPSPTRR
jgi:hypothetical protein